MRLLATMFIAIATLNGCASVPDRFAGAMETGPYSVDGWGFTTRAANHARGDIEVLVAKASGPVYISEDQALTTSRYVEAARLGVADYCSEPHLVVVDRAWEALTARSSTMIVRFECSS